MKEKQLYWHNSDMSILFTCKNDEYMCYYIKVKKLEKTYEAYARKRKHDKYIQPIEDTELNRLLFDFSNMFEYKGKYYDWRRYV